ncbi:transglycosylase SLT domain-containing protein [Hydrogenophaga sp. PAMC20947]|uniref:transglycosylase SLT domain-containing protein n=1 Tax=Hydrogenophaga sp. PAMC20947 TaxID=2565558 RepID=UPI00109DEFFB|nr:transglycosylase SLT domain-containing protein [Hydrogenophaga sp. PAMC20947]QCB45637.1 LysM peptidoglycan-binding domain-containing protein [Hydrogenophaga sp. PAMC20947]
MNPLIEPIDTPQVVAKSSLLQRRSLSTLTLGLILLVAGCASVQTPDPTQGASSAPGSAASTLPAATAARSPSPRLAPFIPSGPLSAIGTESASAAPVVTLSTPTDIWDRIRRGFAMTDLDNDLVRDREQWYVSRPDYMQRMTERSSRYLFHIVEEIERRRIPMELALLPFIESAFNPQAVSSARAAGMWQFMPATGQSFDLKQNVFRDDRRDVLASTKAALDYLEQLHGRFGDWHLALAAYNWGQGNVNRAITRNQRAGLPTGYTDIDMPLETRMYVPKLQAVKNILARPESFGALLPDIGNHPFFDTLTLTSDMDVSLIASLSGVSEADFRVLNPSIKQPIVMAAGTPQILLPWDNAGVFEQRLAAHKGPLASWTAWVVPTTMSVDQAAQRSAMSEEELRRVNNIPPRMLVRAGSSLLVRRSGHRDNDVSEFVADHAQLSLQPEVVLKRTTVRARKGDSLERLASRYGVSASSVAGWNKLSSTSRLKTGQRLTLMLPRSVSGKSVAGSSSSKKSRSVASRKKSSSGKTASKSKSRSVAAKDKRIRTSTASAGKKSSGSSSKVARKK